MSIGVGANLLGVHVGMSHMSQGEKIQAQVAEVYTRSLDADDALQSSPLDWPSALDTLMQERSALDRFIGDPSKLDG